MAPIKFEDNMKEKLEKRTIQPSAEAWSSLANRLEKHEASNSRKSFWWIGIAASILLLIVSGLFFFNWEEHTIMPEIVDAPKEEILDGKQELINKPKEDVVAIQDTKANETNYAEDSKVIKEQKITTEALKKKPKVERLAFNNSAKEKENLELTNTKRNVETLTALPKTKLNLLDEKFNEIMAEIKTLSNDGSVVTDREVDSLLNLAQKELFKNKIFKEDSRIVDADALLESVEFELEESFRTRVFEAIKSNYETVKTAVAERNN